MTRRPSQVAARAAEITLALVLAAACGQKANVASDSAAAPVATDQADP